MIDFIVAHRDGRADAVEAKVSPQAFDADALKTFRSIYPRGANYLVCPFVKEAHTLRPAGMTIKVCGTTEM